MLLKNLTIAVIINAFLVLFTNVGAVSAHGFILITSIGFASLCIFEVLIDYVRGVNHFSEDEDEDDKDFTNDTFSVTVLDRPDTPRAMYLDWPIYDWLKVINVGEQGAKPYRVEYDGICKLVEGSTITIPENSLLFPPGIIYKIVTNEFTSSDI